MPTSFFDKRNLENTAYARCFLTITRRVKSLIVLKNPLDLIPWQVYMLKRHKDDTEAHHALHIYEWYRALLSKKSLCGQLLYSLCPAGAPTHLKESMSVLFFLSISHSSLLTSYTWSSSITSFELLWGLIVSV